MSNLPTTLREKFEACFLLSAVGDAVGYKNGRWEFCYDSDVIQREFNQITDNGKSMGSIDIKQWRVSDDTVMHIATAEALALDHGPSETKFNDLMREMARAYVDCMRDMSGRAPGMRCSASCNYLNRSNYAWDTLPYEGSAGGCGAAMRAMCCGLVYAGDNNRALLVKTAIESGRMTHNNFVGFGGALVSAVFTAFAVEGKPVESWGRLFVDDILPSATRYLDSARPSEALTRDIAKFRDKFVQMLKLRGIWDQTTKPATFPAEYANQKHRDTQWKAWSFNGNGWPGSSGDDSVMISYDALLYSTGAIGKLVYTAVLHGGDNDSTGAIALAWHGALYGYAQLDAGVKSLCERVEYSERMAKLAGDLLAVHDKYYAQPQN